MYAQYVKNTMEPLNIPDVSKDKRFPWTVRRPAADSELGGLGSRQTCAHGDPSAEGPALALGIGAFPGLRKENDVGVGRWYLSSFPCLFISV